MTNKSSRQTVCDLLAHLRTVAGGAPTAAAVDETLEGLSTAVGSLVDEHAGLANELLGVYEQLGVVFEVARRLPTVQGERAVVAFPSHPQPFR